jgi:hypothetical protein
MASRTITGLFDAYDDARVAVNEMEASGIAHRDISIVANNADNRHALAGEGDRPVMAKEGAQAGAIYGTVVAGGTVGLMAGLGMLAVPGVGPVMAAGWLLATLAGAGAGAAVGGATGGIIGSLTEAGVSKENAHVFAEGVRRGGTLVTARVSEDRATAVEAVMVRNHTVDMDARSSKYRTAGWKAFDEKAAPYSAVELQRERDRYRDRPTI